MQRGAVDCAGADGVDANALLVAELGREVADDGLQRRLRAGDLGGGTEAGGEAVGITTDTLTWGAFSRRSVIRASLKPLTANFAAQ